MKLRHYLFLTLLFNTLISPIYAKDSRPNIVVIMSDDSGFTDLGSFGGEIDTPNLDEIAKTGMRFSSFYSNARCSSTRATLLTGVNAAHVGFGGGVVGDWVRELPFPAHRGRLPYDQPLISELLGDNGYQTLMAGKWHLGGSYIKLNQKKLTPAWEEAHAGSGLKLTQEEMEQDYLGLPPQRGFQKSFVFHGAQGNLFFTPEDTHNYYEDNQQAKLKYDNSYKMHCYTDNAFNKKRYGGCHGKSTKAFYATDGMTDRAIEMMDEASGKEKPFFMYVAYRAPHKPLQAPEALVQKYLKRYSNLQKIADDRHQGLIDAGLFPKGVKVANNNVKWTKQDPIDIEKFRLQSAVHGAMVEKIDENVGKLVDSLKASGEYENTLILYFSDNGAASHIGDLMNAPYKGVKALLWEGGARTHAIINWPGVVKPGTITDDIVWVGDIVPTLLDITHVKFPEKFHGSTPRKPNGRNILATLKGQTMAPPEAIFNNDKGQQSVLYQGRWKLLIEPGWYLQTLAKPGINYELYDISIDPGETKNLANDNPDLVAKLTAMSEEWKKENNIVDYAEIIKLKPKDPY